VTANPSAPQALEDRLNSARHRRGITRSATVAVAAASMVLSGAFLASPAFADEGHTFNLDISDQAPIAPGAGGILTYQLTNTSNEAVDGFLINLSMPPTVDLELDPNNCEKFGTNREGDMVSCTFIGGIGQFGPGESKTLTKSYSVAADALASSSLGNIGANVVPIVNGETTEDPTDIKGPHVDYVEVSTSSGSAGALGQLRSLFGF
jgi:hypothetical protein